MGKKVMLGNKSWGGFFRGALAAAGLAIVLGACGSLWLKVKNQRDLFISKNNHSVKSIQDYWRDVGLDSEVLDQVLKNKNCYHSENHFLSCAYVIDNIVAKVPTPDYFWQLKSVGAKLNQTEKQTVEEWREMIRHHKMVQINFEALWKELKEKYISKNDFSYLNSIGINSYYSISKDPHSYIIPADYYGEIVAQLKPKTISLGIVIGKGKENYYIRKVLDFSSAEKSGLKKGDEIIEVNGLSTENLSLSKLTDLLRAEEGQTTLLLMRRNKQIRTVRVYRQASEIPAVSSKIITASNLGLIVLNKFAKGVCEQIKNSIVEFKKSRVRGVLFDLRDNSGGQVEESTCIASLFLGPNHKLLSLKYMDTLRGQEEIVSTEEEIYSGPMAVLVNSGSASASEILAGILQDKKRAVIVGERTFGKGTFQEGEIWSNNSKVALFETKGYFLLPSGRSPQLRGIEPDIFISFRDTDNLREEDLYWQPLNAPENNRSELRNISTALEKCLEYDESLGQDVQMQGAASALYCPSVASSLHVKSQ